MFVHVYILVQICLFSSVRETVSHLMTGWRDDHGPTNVGAIVKIIYPESRHAGGTVDPEQVTVEIHPGVECTKEDFLQGGGETSTITDIWAGKGL